MAQLCILRAQRVLTPTEEIRHGAVAVADGRIQTVGPASVVGSPPGARVIDCGDATIVPGFVDIHIHGSGGDSAMAGPEAVARIARFLPRHGVTSWAPTLTPRTSIAEMTAIVRASLAGGRRISGGAEILGLHLEGPFLSPKRPGAIRPEWFHAPSLASLDALVAAGEGQVRLMTLAPELPGGIDLVRSLVARGVRASIGHSDADCGQAMLAIEAGVSHATHTFNAMRGFHHRDPGVVGAVLASDVVRGELIADGIHVDPLAMGLLIRTKGPQRVALITDAVAPAGLPAGSYEFEGRPIDVRDGRATLVNGAIAGSVATFDANVRRMVRECRVPLDRVALMAATVPAFAVGAADRKGSLTGGRDADLVALDADLQVRLTMVRGTIVFNSL